MSEELLTDVAQIARMLGVSTNTVYTMAHTGQRPVQQIGGKGGKVYSRHEWIERYKQGLPGFWSPTPKESAKERIAFLHRAKLERMSNTHEDE